MGASIAIVGGGMIGVACAFRLQKAGFDVTLFDPGDTQRGASFGNAGHIATEQVAPLATRAMLKTAPSQVFGVGGALDFRWRDIGLWLPWAMRFLRACNPITEAAGQSALTRLLQDALPAWQALVADAGQPELVQDHGHVMLWMEAARATKGLRGALDAAKGTATATAMSEAQLSDYGALLSSRPLTGAVFTGTGQIEEPDLTRQALRHAFVAAGGMIEAASVTAITGEAQAKLHFDSKPTREFHQALVCAGAWSGALLRAFDVNVPLIGERGYHVQTPQHSWPQGLPPTVFEERSLIMTRFSGGLRASSHLEYGHPDAPADPRKWSRLDDHIDALGLPFEGERTYWVGPRPTLPDYLPAIGRLKQAPCVLYAFGHQHLGITMAAITADLVAKLAAGEKTQIDLSPFVLERFKRT